MKYLLFILGIVLWVGIGSRKSLRKSISAQEDDSHTSDSGMRSAFESLFADQPKAAPSFAEEEASAGYFTYESEPVSTASNMSSFQNPVSMDSPIGHSSQVMTETSEIVPPGFDLRQAIIYNSILTAKYIPEANLPEIN